MNALSWHARTRTVPVAVIALSLTFVGIGSSQEPDPPVVDRLAVEATVRFLAKWAGPEWELGTVTTSLNPTCTAISPRGGGPRFLLAAVDSVELRVIVEADTLWRSVDIAAIRARELGCPARGTPR